ncbi:MAG: hypothetical protein V4657_09430 [Pseudomonadota bacterium]
MTDQLRADLAKAMVPFLYNEDCKRRAADACLSIITPLLDKERHTPTAESDGLREALEAAPIIGLWEDAASFKVRQDNWLNGPYREALATTEGEADNG